MRYESWNSKVISQPGTDDCILLTDFEIINPPWMNPKLHGLITSYC